MNIQPISELKNYNTILNEVKVGEPMYLTKNGKGLYIIFDINEADDYQEYKLFKNSFQNDEIRSHEFFIKDVKDLEQKLLESCIEAEKDPIRYSEEDIISMYKSKYGKR